jgi:hypothetical protein
MAVEKVRRPSVTNRTCPQNPKFIVLTSIQWFSMSRINHANPIVINVSDKHGNSAEAQGSFGMDDWSNPTMFVVRLDYVEWSNGSWEHEPIARFDHDGHSVFKHNPPKDGFHIDVYKNGKKNKIWLQTPPPHTNIHDIFDYCRQKLYTKARANHLYQTWLGQIPNFSATQIGLNPV